jgi:hypothetical protein
MLTGIYKRIIMLTGIYNQCEFARTKQHANKVRTGRAARARTCK